MFVDLFKKKIAFQSYFPLTMKTLKEKNLCCKKKKNYKCKWRFMFYFIFIFLSDDCVIHMEL